MTPRDHPSFPFVSDMNSPTAALSLSRRALWELRQMTLLCVLALCRHRGVPLRSLSTAVLIGLVGWQPQVVCSFRIHPTHAQSCLQKMNRGLIAAQSNSALTGQLACRATPWAGGDFVSLHHSLVASLLLFLSFLPCISSTRLLPS